MDVSQDIFQSGRYPNRTPTKPKYKAWLPNKISSSFGIRVFILIRNSLDIKILVFWNDTV